MWIGEAILRHHNNEPQVHANHPVALQIYDLCAEYKVPITVHQDTARYKDAYKELEDVADLKPNCAFVLHSGWFGALEVGQIIQRHTNLFVELAGALENDSGEFLGLTEQDQFAYPDGTIRQEWRWVLEKYQDRIINGFDFWLEWQYSSDNLKKNVEYWRNLLGQIDPVAAERIAYKNVEDLLAHKVDLTTRTVVTSSASQTSTVMTTRATSVSTTSWTATTLRTETKAAISTQLVAGVFTPEAMMIAGVATTAVVAFALVYLLRRRK